MYEARQNKEKVSRRIDSAGGRTRQSRKIENGWKRLQTNFHNPYISPMQFSLKPRVDCAINEVRDKRKREKYFTNNTNVWYNDNLTTDNIAGECHENGKVQYKKNPRTIMADNRNSLISALNITHMHNIKSDDQGILTLNDEQDPLLPIQEFTFLLKDDIFHIAPNSQDSKYVHPNIIGGWPEVDSAGTLKMNSTHIIVTNDSGHYRPKETDIDTAHRKIRTLLETNNDNKKTGNRKFHKLHWYNNHLEYKKAKL